MNPKLERKLIVFEGNDGCGKDTQMRLTHNWLLRLGVDPIRTTRQPGGSPLGAKLRQLILDQDNDWTDMAEAFLFAADQAENARWVQEGFDQNATVLSSRWIYSSITYQGHGRGLPLKFIERLSLEAIDGLMPDLTIWLDVPVEEGLKRVQADRPQLDRIELADRDFHARVRHGYHELAAKFPDFHRINGLLTREEIQAEIQSVIRSRFSV